MPTLTLLTDFGQRDAFVGTMKGVLLRYCPEARLVDLTHEISPGDIHAAAFVLANAWRWFPPDTVHVVVVDPGVGGPRPAIAIRTRQTRFVGPDNGVLSWAVREEPAAQVRRLENRQLFLQPVSCTFHGRDVFAPVAARLAAGLPWSRIGPIVPNFVRLPWPEPSRRGAALVGQVIHVDRFGNAITNLPAAWLKASHRHGLVSAGSRTSIPLRDCYQSVPPRRPLALIGSSGLLEIAINQGSAADQLTLRRGARVTVRLPGA